MNETILYLVLKDSSINNRLVCKTWNSVYLAVNKRYINHFKLIEMFNTMLLKDYEINYLTVNYLTCIECLQKIHKYNVSTYNPIDVLGPYHYGYNNIDDYITDNIQFNEKMFKLLKNYPNIQWFITENIDYIDEYRHKYYSKNLP